MPRKFPKLATLFRYSIADLEALANTYPDVMIALSQEMEIHRFSFRSRGVHRLHDQANVWFHEFPLVLDRGCEVDKWMKTLLWFALTPAIGLWARFKRVDLVCIEESLPFVALMMKWMAGCPVIMTGPDIFWDVYLPEKGFGSYLRSVIAPFHRFALRRIDYYITHTYAFQRYLQQLGIMPERVFIVREACSPNMFYPSDRAAARAACQFADDEVVLLHHGILNPSKGLDRIIRWLPELFDRHPQLKFVVAGDGTLRRQLELLTRELGIEDRILFLGWQQDVAYLNQLLNACDISLVMRSGRFSDHFQLTGNLLHSLTCGCCTLAGSLEGIGELVRDGENGLLFEPNDAEAFKSQLERLVQDADLRRRLGEAARQTAKSELNPEKVQADWTAHICRIMEQAIKRSTGRHY